MRFSHFPALLLVVVAFAASCCSLASAKEEVKITSFDDMWKGALTKLRAQGKLSGQTDTTKVENAIVKVAGQAGGNLRGQTAATNLENAIVKVTSLTTSAKNWENAIVKVNAGAKLKPLDTISSKQKTALEKLKASGQLNNVNEAQVAKITTDVAQELVKNPSKWRYVKKGLEITAGAVLAALIFIGIEAMISP